jgi:hypothetical protein
LAFSASSYTVAQAAGTLSVTVTRTGTGTDAVSVNYATSDGTAVAGTDYTAADGTLQWGAGDLASKVIKVAVSNAVSFSGTRTFKVALSDPSPSADAELGSLSTATVNISGSTAGSGGAPAAPTSVQLTNQGANSETLTWTAAVAGIAPIAHYNIYRNGEAYATTTGTTYTDKAATNATVSSFAAPATIYSYQVSAVDTSGNEGPLASEITFWAYYNGTFFWGGDYSNVTVNYKDTAGIPESGAYDIAITSVDTSYYYQPFSGGTASPQWAEELGAFKYMVLDLKPGVANQTWQLDIISRLPQGDVYNNAVVELPGNYGPAPVVGQWGHYKIPLNPDLAVGTGSFVGSISGTTLTVSAVNAAMSVQTTAWLTGVGVTVPTSINAFGTGSGGGTGGTGTYTLSASSSVPAGTTIDMQRTNIYKFSLIDESGTTNTYYIDNVGFTTF